MVDPLPDRGTYEVSLREITGRNLRAVLALRVTEGQRKVYSRSNAYSIAEGHYPPDDDPVWIRAIYAGEIPVGLRIADRALLGNFAGVDYHAYFLGVRCHGALAAASLVTASGVPDGKFRFAVDDLVTVPEAARAAQIAFGCAGLALLRLARRLRAPAQSRSRVRIPLV